MAETTHEEAARCPRCREPGDMHRKEPLPRGGHIEHFRCMNERCQGEGLGWIVQVDAQGRIPQRRSTPDEKQFPAMSADMMAWGQRNVEDAVGRDMREERPS